MLVAGGICTGKDIVKALAMGTKAAF